MWDWRSGREEVLFALDDGATAADAAEPAQLAELAQLAQLAALSGAERPTGGDGGMVSAASWLPSSRGRGAQRAYAVEGEGEVDLHPDTSWWGGI